MNNGKKKVISSLFWKFAERITAQIVSLFISILLARLLTPSDYGSVSIVMIFITIANVFVSSGLGNALIQKAEVDNVDYSSVFYINLLISFSLYVAIFFIAPIVAKFYNLQILTNVMRVLALRIPIAAINSVQQAYVARHMLFKRFFWSTLFGTLISGVIGVICAFCGFGVWALVIQYLTNTCVDTMILWFTIRWRPEFVFSLKKAKELFSYGWKLLASALLDTGYNQLRGLIIGKVYSTTDLAYYNQGDKYPSLIVVNVNTSISSVLFPALSKFQNDINKLKELTRKSIQISSYIMWPLMIGLAVIAEPLVSLILTDKWLACVPYMRIFCLSYGLWPVHTSNLQAINALGRSDLFLKLEIIKKILGLFVLIITLDKGPLAIAKGLVVVGIISTFINASPNKKLLNYTFKEQMKDMLPAFILAIIMGIIISPISLLSMKPLLIVIIQVISGVSIYILLSLLTKNREYTYLRNTILKTVNWRKK